MPFYDLMAVFRVWRPDKGWRCVSLTNYTVTLRHAGRETDMKLIKGANY